MIVEKMRSYFLYNIPMVNISFFDQTQNTELGIKPRHIEALRENFPIEDAFVPAFYTKHYKQDHKPYTIAPSAERPAETFISYERLNELSFFTPLDIKENLKLTWDIKLQLQNIGLITICVEHSNPLVSHLAYRLNGLHLNDDYKVIATEPIAYLWDEAQSPRPEYVKLDTVAEAIRQYYLGAIVPDIKPILTLQHEIQMPFSVIEVQGYESADDFFDDNQAEVIEFVAKPHCWEINQLSRRFIREIVNEETRIWSVANDVLMLAGYEGAVLIQLMPREECAETVSNFNVTQEGSILHSFQIAVSNYHLLRIIDDWLDVNLPLFYENLHKHQGKLRDAIRAHEILPYEVLVEINEYLIDIENFWFSLLNGIEEFDNPDKLVDDDFHIKLIRNLYYTLGTNDWVKNINDRFQILNQWISTTESIYHSFWHLRNSIEDTAIQNRQNTLGLVFSALVLFEVLTAVISIFEDQYLDNTTRIVLISLPLIILFFLWRVLLRNNNS